MPTEELLKILLQTNQLLQKTSNLSDEDIIKEAINYFKENKKEILKFFLKNEQSKNHLILTAGASGVGKSEFVKNLNKKYNYNVVDIDEIRKIFPFYSGQNASLFQKPSIKVVEYLVDYFFKHNLSFIIDSNLASFKVAQKNIERALKRNYKIDIYFLYRDYHKCKEYTKIREEKEGRRVNDEVFNKKAENSLLVIKEIINTYYDNDNVSIYINEIDKQQFFLEKTQMLKKIDEYFENLKNFLQFEYMKNLGIEIKSLNEVEIKELDNKPNQNKKPKP